MSQKPIKDQVMEQVSKDLQFPLDVVEKVIGWSYKKAAEATKMYDEIEVSGFSKFQLSKAKVKRRIKTLERMEKHLENNPEKEESLKQVREVKENLKKKL